MKNTRLRTSPPSPGAITHDEACAMMRAVFRLFDLWDISSQQGRTLLGRPSTSTYNRWRAGKVASIPHDTAWRLGLLIGIYKGTRYLFTEAARSYAWMKKPNRAFNGQSALDRMLAGAPMDLSAVRDYLYAELGATELPA